MNGRRTEGKMLDLKVPILFKAKQIDFPAGIFLLFPQCGTNPEVEWWMGCSICPPDAVVNGPGDPGVCATRKPHPPVKQKRRSPLTTFTLCACAICAHLCTCNMRPPLHVQYAPTFARAICAHLCTCNMRPPLHLQYTPTFARAICAHLCTCNMRPPLHVQYAPTFAPAICAHLCTCVHLCTCNMRPPLHVQYAPTFARAICAHLCTCNMRPPLHVQYAPTFACAICAHLCTCNMRPPLHVQYAPTFARAICAHLCTCNMRPPLHVQYASTFARAICVHLCTCNMRPPLHVQYVSTFAIACGLGGIQSILDQILVSIHQKRAQVSWGPLEGKTKPRMWPFRYDNVNWCTQTHKRTDPAFASATSTKLHLQSQIWRTDSLYLWSGGGGCLRWVESLPRVSGSVSQKQFQFSKIVEGPLLLQVNFYLQIACKSFLKIVCAFANCTIPFMRQVFWFRILLSCSLFQSSCVFSIS